MLADALAVAFIEGANVMTTGSVPTWSLMLSLGGLVAVASRWFYTRGRTENAAASTAVTNTARIDSMESAQTALAARVKLIEKADHEESIRQDEREKMKREGLANSDPNQSSASLRPSI